MVDQAVTDLPYVEGEKATPAETRAIELLAELVVIVWDQLPEQHVMEKRELQDKVASLADALYARIGLRAHDADAVRAFKARSDTYYADAKRRGIRTP